MFLNPKYISIVCVRSLSTILHLYHTTTTVSQCVPFNIYPLAIEGPSWILWKKTSQIWINDHSALSLPNIEIIRTDHSLSDFVSLINIFNLPYYTFGFFKLFCCKPLFCFHGNSIQFWKLYILNYWTHQRGISPHFISLK